MSVRLKTASLSGIMLILFRYVSTDLLCPLTFHFSHSTRTNPILGCDQFAYNTFLLTECRCSFKKMPRIAKKHDCMYFLTESRFLNILIYNHTYIFNTLSEYLWAKQYPKHSHSTTYISIKHIGLYYKLH